MCTARDASKHGNVEDADSRDADHQAGAVNGRQQNGREQSGECKRKVGGAHHHFFHPAAFGRGQKPQRNAKTQANAHSDETDQQRVLTAHQQQRSDVSAQAVGAKPMLRTGFGQFVGNVDVAHRVG
jgi:hypothetical protein